MNNGERDELIAIMQLIDIRDKGLIFDGVTIQSIKVNGFECKELPNCYNLQDLTQLSDFNLTLETAKYGVGKAPALSKADVQINDVGYSVKSNRSAPPALVNHTTRPGFENVLSKVGQDIAVLDEIINEYWRLRKGKIIGEDVKNSDMNSPFKDYKEFLRPILNYFFFEGTGSKDSSFPAEKTINIIHPLDINQWTVYDKSNAMDLYWDKLIFSVRAKKGMPSGYPNELSNNAKLVKSSIDKWTEYFDSHHRGALHIRASK